MEISINGLTDVGKKRDHNEDFYIIEDSLNLAVVCDGMGGHAAGEVASKLAAESVLEYFKDNIEVFQKYAKEKTFTNANEVKCIIHEGVAKACCDVWYTAMHDETKRGMGTTMVLSLIIDNQAFIAHVGDSRAYLFREGQVEQLTEDHSFVNEMVKQGLMTKEQAAKSPHANVITKALGQQEFVKPDIIQTELMDGDGFLLCSDGLSEYYQVGDISQEFRDQKDPDKLLKAFINKANESGGKDNITAVIVNVGDVGSKDNVTNISHKLKALKKVPLFKNFNYTELNKLVEIVKVRIYPQGEFVIKEGTSGEEMFVILDGEVEVLFQDVSRSTLKSGQLFGEMALIDKSPRSASIRTTRESKVMVINRSPLFNIFKQEPRIAMKVFWSFLQNMNKRLRANDKKLTELEMQFINQDHKSSEDDSGSWDDLGNLLLKED